MIVLYTAIFGGSDSLKRAPVGPDRCVCFTDDVGIRGKGWEVRVRPKVDKARRAARECKMAPHALFPDATASVWSDGSIEIRDWPRLLEDCSDHEIACLPHPDRSSCYDEGRTVIRLKIAHASKVNMALELYRREGFRPARLSTTGLFFRRHTARVAAFNRLWRDHLDRFGTNDQVHVDFAAWKNGITIGVLEGHYRDNPYMAYDRVDHHQRRKPQFLPDREPAHYLEG